MSNCLEQLVHVASFMAFLSLYCGVALTSASIKLRRFGLLVPRMMPIGQCLAVVGIFDFGKYGALVLT